MEALIFGNTYICIYMVFLDFSAFHSRKNLGVVMEDKCLNAVGK